VSWEVRKDRILETCMSEKWIEGKRRSNFMKQIENGEMGGNIKELMEAKEFKDSKGRRGSQPGMKEERRKTLQKAPGMDSPKGAGRNRISTMGRKRLEKQAKVVAPSLLKQQFSLKSLATSKRFQF
jgi:hypothetical protein